MALGDEVAVSNGASDPKEEPNDPVNALIEESEPSEPLSNTSSEGNSVTEETEVVNEPELSADEEVSEKEDADGVPEEEEEEEDLIDPMDDIREECKAGSEAVKMAQILEECQNRVNSRSNTEETCHEEMIDYVHAVDHCMAKSVFSKLK